MHRPTQPILRAVGVLAVLATVALPSDARTYHVDAAHPQANDANDGSTAEPWKTLRHAVRALAAGDLLLVAAGEYDERVSITVSGTGSEPITLRAEPPRKARVQAFALEGDHIAIEGFEIVGGGSDGHGIFAGETHRGTARTGCRMVDNLVRDVEGTAIVTGEKAIVRGNLLRNVFRGVHANSGTLVESNEVDTLRPVMQQKDGEAKPRKTQYMFFAGDDITFRGNHLHGAPPEFLAKGMGVCFFGSWDAWIIGPSHRILIEGNRCFGATHASEPMATAKRESSHITYRNNLFVDTVFVGVMPKAFRHVTVENNTFINCGAYPVWLQGEQCQTAVVRNNLIAYRNRDQAVKAFGWKEAESGVRIHFEGSKDFCDNNLFFACVNRQYGKQDTTAEPRFVDPDRNDYRLAAGSPGIDAGMTLPAVETDLRGVRRPQGSAHDIGAYEFVPEGGQP